MASFTLRQANGPRTILLLPNLYPKLSISQASSLHYSSISLSSSCRSVSASFIPFHPRLFASFAKPQPKDTTTTLPSTEHNGKPKITTPISKPSLAPPPSHQIQSISKTGLNDAPPEIEIDEAGTNNRQVDWTRSYHGLSAEPFSKEAAAILLQPLDHEDVEIKPDGIVYLPEIKYRRILNKAFGPGGWGLVPRSESIVTTKTVTREYALVAHGRLVSIARGEQDYFSPDGIPTATEGCKSNAMMRCCKDLGVASELWDPRWIRTFKAAHGREVFVEHAVNKRKSKIWIRKDDEVRYPWKQAGR
ncbi:hypothetical protein FQN57_001605 [Myotisia sp. PD_48]|nr:hypothetical protein FQN57_001605 [Myotisia sp. PD_48]